LHTDVVRKKHSNMACLSRCWGYIVYFSILLCILYNTCGIY